MPVPLASAKAVFDELCHKVQVPGRIASDARTTFKSNQ